MVQTSVLVANRSQASPDAAHDQSLRNKPRLGTIQAIRQIIKRHGVLGLYTGFQLHLLRDTLGTGLYFAIYESVKLFTASAIGQGTTPFGGPMIAGALCSTLPWFCVSGSSRSILERLVTDRLCDRHIRLIRGRPVPRASSWERPKRSAKPPSQLPSPRCTEASLFSFSVLPSTTSFC